MSKRPHLYKATCRLYLLFDRVNSSFYRRFEELCNFVSGPVALFKAFQIVMVRLTLSASADLDGYRHLGPYQVENRIERIGYPSYRETDA